MKSAFFNHDSLPLLGVLANNTRSRTGLAIRGNKLLFFIGISFLGFAIAISSNCYTKNKSAVKSGNDFAQDQIIKITNIVKREKALVYSNYWQGSNNLVYIVTIKNVSPHSINLHYYQIPDLFKNFSFRHHPESIIFTCNKGEKVMYEMFHTMNYSVGKVCLMPNEEYTFPLNLIFNEERIAMYPEPILTYFRLKISSPDDISYLMKKMPVDSYFKEGFNDEGYVYYLYPFAFYHWLNNDLYLQISPSRSVQ